MRTRLSIVMLTVSIITAFSLGTVPSVTAQQGVELGEVAVITAEVVAIDRVDRNVTLKGSGGNVVTVEVSHAARNFDQIEIGDQVKVEYYEAIAIYVGKEGTKPGTVAGLITARAPGGEKPAGVAVETVDLSATIEAIDKNKRTITLKGDDGKLVTIKGGNSVEGFDNLNVGDSIHTRFTEAIAISVEKP